MRVPIVIAACAASALFAGCGAATTGGGALPAAIASKGIVSWMNSAASSGDLLYVSDSDNEVTVYTYKSQQLVGVLTGFTQPMGGCADSRGNVYISDYAAQTLVEYAHGKGKPVRSLSDAPDSPYGCAVDPTTGNLAVANDDGMHEGNIAIWTNASGEPVRYTDPTLGAFRSCAYDPHGNLLVTNGIQGYPYDSDFAWLPSGGTKLVDLSIPRSGTTSDWSGVYGVAWDGKDFAISDNAVYRVALLHGQAYYVGATPLQYPEEGRPDGPYTLYFPGGRGQATQAFVGADVGISGAVLMWEYPAGGQVSGEITHGIDYPYAITISYQKDRGV
ncbi:MAG TPA: hypothetical protein VGG51_13695 [Candidatus Cybelea sp.]|jgi:WD40 repeat protein